MALNVILPLITFPYISRILQVDGLGKYNYASSIISYFSLIAALGISTYAIREGAARRNDREELEKFCSQVFTINMLSTVLAYVLLGCLLATGWLGGYTALILVLCISIFFNTLGTGWVFSIFENYFYITIRSIIFQVVSILLIFLLVKQPEDLILYAGITVLASVGTNIVNFICARRYCRIRLVRKIDFKTHIIPILVLFASAVASTVYVNSDITILGILKTDYEVGLYSVSAKIYSAVKFMLAAVLVVSAPRLSMYKAQNKLTEFRALLTKLFDAVTAMVLPAATGLFLLSEEIVILISGQSYAPAASSLRLLSIALVFSQYAWLFNQNILIPAKKEKIMLAATITSAVVNVAANLILIPRWSENAAAFTTIISEIIMMVIGMWFGFKVTEFDKGRGKNVASSLLGCAAIVIICMIAKTFLVANVAIIICSIVFSVAAYAAIVLALRNSFALQLTENIRKRIKKS